MKKLFLLTLALFTLSCSLINVEIATNTPSTATTAVSPAQPTTARATTAPATTAPTPRVCSAYMTFAINTHDTGHVTQSADTLKHAMDIFEKYGVRGDFYLTAPMVELYAKQRPDVIERLKNSKMTISYHVRPPHPLYSGFDSRLKNLDDKTLAATLRDYETYRLDPATGDLDKTQLNKPLVQDNGLWVRPSDFSVTRWTPAGGNNETFWWNMLTTPKAAEFNPTSYLKTKLSAWKGSRPPFVTALIHENNFVYSGAEAWTLIYFSDTQKTKALTPPFNLNAPDSSKLRSQTEQDLIWKAYDDLVGYAAKNVCVVTSEDIVAMATK
ncbi:MAG: hypothetical protein HY740_02645 [Chloroflexi bacterium]|nr:hypothetical protein [Chloroflexota bacterium]